MTGYFRKILQYWFWPLCWPDSTKETAEKLEEQPLEERGSDDGIQRHQLCALENWTNDLITETDKDEMNRRQQPAASGSPPGEDREGIGWGVPYAGGFLCR